MTTLTAAAIVGQGYSPGHAAAFLEWHEPPRPAVNGPANGHAAASKPPKPARQASPRLAAALAATRPARPPDGKTIRQWALAAHPGRGCPARGRIPQWAYVEHRAAHPEMYPE